MLDRLVSRVVLGTIAPVSLMLAGWWGSVPFFCYQAGRSAPSPSWVHAVSGIDWNGFWMPVASEGGVMPVAVIVALVALLGALVCYSMGVWGAFRAKTVRGKDVKFLYVGFVFDTLATLGMAVQAKGLDLTPLSDLLHTVFAFVAMFAMLAVAITASRALASGDSKTMALVPNWALSGWALWIAMFVWGLLARGSARMGG